MWKKGVDKLKGASPGWFQRYGVMLPITTFSKHYHAASLNDEGFYHRNSIPDVSQIFGRAAKQPFELASGTEKRHHPNHCIENSIFFYIKMRLKVYFSCHFALTSLDSQVILSGAIDSLYYPSPYIDKSTSPWELQLNMGKKKKHINIHEFQ